MLMQKLIKTRNKRSGGSSYLKIFYKTYLQNLKYKKEHVPIFHLILVGLVFLSLMK